MAYVTIVRILITVIPFEHSWGVLVIGKVINLSIFNRFLYKFNWCFDTFCLAIGSVMGRVIFRFEV